MQKTNEKPLKIVSGLFISIALIVFIFIIIYQQVLYPTNIKIDEEQSAILQNNYTELNTKTKKVKQEYKNVVPSSNQKDTNLSEDEIKKIKEKLDKTQDELLSENTTKEEKENYQKIEKYKNVTDYFKKYNTPYTTKENPIQDRQLEETKNLEECFAQISQNYPIGSIVPFIQFYQTQGDTKNISNVNGETNLIDLVRTPGIHEYNGIYFIPLIGGDISFTENNYTDLKNKCPVFTSLMFQNNTEYTIPNGYQRVLRQDDQNLSQSDTNGYTTIDINKNFYHLDQTHLGKSQDDKQNYNGTDQKMDYQINDISKDGVSIQTDHDSSQNQIFVSGLKNCNQVPQGSQNLSKMFYHPIGYYEQNQYKKDYGGAGGKNNTKWGGQECCRSISNQGIYLDDAKQISDQYNNVQHFSGKYYHETTDQQLQDINILDSHVNSIFLLIIGYA